MGLLDASYSAVNTKKPRKSDRILPATELNARGLLDAATNVPIAGDALSGVLAAYDAAKGDYGSAAVNALGVLPFVSGTFIGKGAKTWDAVKAAEAAKRIDAGENAAKVWKETGYGKAPWDKAARSEIDDSASTYNPNAYKQKEFYVFGKPAGKGSVANVSELLDHKKLVNSYPDLSSVSVREMPSSARNDVYGTGEYSPATDSIGIGTAVPNNGEGVAESLLDFASDKDKPVLLHELQHAIQQREGWARGGSAEMFPDEQTINDARLVAARIAKGEKPSEAAKWIAANLGRNPSVQVMDLAMKPKAELHSMPSNPHEGYKRLAGEAEARLTQARMNLSPEQRLAQYPYDPEYFKQATGVDINNLIVRGLLE